ncbi:hypothetical protein Pyn_01983 [Prunus yedoensis var. nudiflora]|uniref:Uncharacterized protein n=1 Tax=Prunus yedoensis var. nudiflora TaxID=2094558 RepID=A0A314ZDR7_PRUYE|nr:hypothetical protein Pyn_01983 [Prunus yedoensis var. nudiflora]
MALLTTSHDIGIHINTSIVTGGYSASRCNGLTDTACRIAHSELDFDLEFMLDSEFSIRILGTGTPIVEKGLDPGHSVCGRPVGERCHVGGNNGKPEHCSNVFNKGC